MGTLADATLPHTENLKALSFKSSARDGASLEFMQIKASHRAGDVQIVLFGDGFEASRYVNSDDLREIRDWIEAALSASHDAGQAEAKEG